MNQKAMARQLAVIHDIERPNIDDIVKEIFTDFMELHGDRLYGEDHAMCAGIARLNGMPVQSFRAGRPAMRILSARAKRHCWHSCVSWC